MGAELIARKDIVANPKAYSKKALRMLPGGTEAFCARLSPDLWKNANLLANSASKGANIGQLGDIAKKVRDSLFQIRYRLELPNSGNVGMSEEYLYAQPPFVSVTVNGEKGIKVKCGQRDNYLLTRDGRGRLKNIESLPEQIVRIAAGMVEEVIRELRQ